MDHKTIERAIRASDAKRALDYLGPTLGEMEDSIKNEAFRAVSSGTLTGELATALWHRLHAVNEIKENLTTTSKSADRQVDEVLAGAFPDGNTYPA